MKRIANGKKSILKRLLFPIMGILLLQAILYSVVILEGSVVNKSDENSFEILNERVINRKLYIENEMVHRWSNFEEGEARILKSIDATLSVNGAVVEDIKSNAALNEKIITDLAPDLIYLLRKNEVTGAFVILDGVALENDVEGNSYAGLYIRDLDPSGYSQEKSDLLIERGLPSVSKALNITLDRYWSAAFTFTEQGKDKNEQFFFKPLRTARVRHAQNSGEYMYWSAPFSLHEHDIKVITCSIPLISVDGTIFGVMGIDITQNYLRSLLKYDEIGPDKTGAYFMGIDQTYEGGKFTRVCTNGPVYSTYFGDADVISGWESKFKNIYEFESQKKKKSVVYGSVQPIRLYNSNTPFEYQQWVLVGMMESDHLLRFSNSIKSVIYYATAISLLLGAVGVYIASRRMVQPITKLVSDLKKSDPNKPIRLDKINIEEIDALTVSIEELSSAVADSASRISKIIEMANIPVGVFEHNINNEKVFCSKNWFVLMKPERDDPRDDYISKDDFDQVMLSLNPFLTNSEKIIYRIPGNGGNTRWLQLTYIVDEKRILGAVLDITRDMREKQKIEYERDYDILTDLFNRRAFEQRIKELFTDRSKLKTAALIMWDLDNLKYINDTFGHNCGDQYIRVLSQELMAFNHEKGIAARRSGDEFYVLLYGYESKQVIMEQIQLIWQRIQLAKLDLPNEEYLKMRVSAGIAWYPQDAESYDELIRYADFAMYSVKHTIKGNIQEFDKGAYLNNSVLVNGTEALNLLIENQMVRYALQPIVEVSTGLVYGYEMLMRSEIEELKNPVDILRLARVQSKLYQIEKLTFFCAMETFGRLVENGGVPKGTKVFINSIGSQILTNSDILLFQEMYREFLKDVVLEITESEQHDNKFTKTKVEIVKSWDGMIALDDYGQGYNGESVLIFLSPDIVKVDISIVRTIDRDVNRQNILENLVSYAKKRNIKILAEGVETREEVEVLIQFGVDYMQGYYFGKPVFEPSPINPSVLEDIQRIYKKMNKG